MQARLAHAARDADWLLLLEDDVWLQVSMALSLDKPQHDT